MIRRMFNALPGPTPVRVVLAVIITVVAFVALMFLYDWMGSNLLDSGGAFS
ncbi:MAG: hypothetical protein QGD89_04600 [Actinomycetota bacterium]|nr:hypothetical protein [Actinomycetota bacterium]